MWKLPPKDPWQDLETQLGACLSIIDRNRVLRGSREGMKWIGLLKRGQQLLLVDAAVLSAKRELCKRARGRCARFALKMYHPDEPQIVDVGRTRLANSVADQANALRRLRKVALGELDADPSILRRRVMYSEWQRLTYDEKISTTLLYACEVVHKATNEYSDRIDEAVARAVACAVRLPTMSTGREQPASLIVNISRKSPRR